MRDHIFDNIIRASDFKIEDRGYSTPCWIWLKAINDLGYGKIRIGSQQYSAHRLAHCLHYRLPFVSNLDADHKCRVRCCINPEHIQMISRAENVLLGEGITAKNARLTECRICGGELKYRTRSNRGISRYCPICQYSKQKAKQVK